MIVALEGDPCHGGEIEEEDHFCSSQSFVEHCEDEIVSTCSKPDQKIRVAFDNDERQEKKGRS